VRDTASKAGLDVVGLHRTVAGPVLLPGDVRYAAEVAVFNLNNPLEPAVAVGAAGVADVQATVRFAAERQLPVAVRATGHQVVQDVHECLMINTSRMTGIRIDAANRTARVEAGVRWSAVVAEAAEHGLAPMSGSSPTVGVVGYTLGGGLSPVLGRFHGYAADHVTRIEVVTSDGAFRQATADSEPDLFWALRGGKANLGVVTAIEFELFPVSEFYGGGMYFPGERMADVLRVWRTWAPGLPKAATTSVAVKRLPFAPSLPEPVRGAFVLHVRFAYLGPAEDGERLFAPIRGVAPPLLDEVQMLPYTENPLIHRDQTSPSSFYDRTTTLRDLSPGTLDKFIELTGPESDCALASVEIRALGGALDSEPAVANAVSTRGIPYLLFGLGRGGPNHARLIRGHLDRLVGGLAPSVADDRRMLNFLSIDEATTPEQMRLVYGAECYDRLAKIKRLLDPDDIFRVNHNIRPA
jgi:FAD/FMN-containing dehydrogenase